MLSVEDRSEIEQLYARYNVAIDGADVEGWVELWAPNAEFHAHRLVSGRDELRTYTLGRPSRMKNDGWYRMMHFNSSLIVDGDGDRATGSCYLVVMAQQSLDTKPTINVMGMYQDELERLNGRWLFRKRAVDVTFSAVQ